MTDPVGETIAFYEKAAPDYTASGAQGCARDLDAFLDRLEPGARILELGCGGGRDAARMVERGFEVDPTDGTAAMVRKARERFNLPARLMRFDEMDAVAKYDAVWAHASLLHVPRAALPDILVRIAHALRPGGWHYANFKLGDAEARDRLGRLYNFMSADEYAAVYEAIPQWRIVERTEYAGSGYDGVARRWIAVTVQRGD